MQDLISKLSEIRSEYNCFNQDEEPYYRALSEVISILSIRADGDTISRQAAIDAVDSETVSTNPEHFKSSEKFIEFMDDTDIASFGKWQWANGFNTALVATTVQLKNLPSTERRGRWEFNIDDKGWSWDKPYMCDQCGKWNGIETPYCPHCGAKMDEVGE